MARRAKRVYDAFTNCGVRYSKTAQDVSMDQDEYIKTLRPIQHPELTGAPAEAAASKIVSDMLVSLRWGSSVHHFDAGVDPSVHCGTTANSRAN